MNCEAKPNVFGESLKRKLRAQIYLENNINLGKCPIFEATQKASVLEESLKRKSIEQKASVDIELVKKHDILHSLNTKNRQDATKIKTGTNATYKNTERANVRATSLETVIEIAQDQLKASSSKNVPTVIENSNIKEKTELETKDTIHLDPERTEGSTGQVDDPQNENLTNYTIAKHISDQSEIENVSIQLSRVLNIADNMCQTKNSKQTEDKLQFKETTKSQDRADHNAFATSTPTTTRINKTEDIPTATKQYSPFRPPYPPNLVGYIAQKYHLQIQYILLRLNALASHYVDNDLILIKVVMCNGSLISNTSFDLMKVNLMYWIDLYEKQFMCTPKFEMTRGFYDITVICKDLYAMNCLLECARTLTMVRFTRLPSITTILYCYDAVIQGKCQSNDRFLQQLRFHRYKLLTDFWCCVSHDYCAHKNETTFIYVIDERSALALNYYYKNVLTIYMNQRVTFTNLGVVC